MATLRVNESRPAELSQQPEASLAWWRATSTAKRRQRVPMPCDLAPKSELAGATVVDPSGGRAEAPQWLGASRSYRGPRAGRRDMRVAREPERPGRFHRHFRLGTRNTNSPCPRPCVPAGGSESAQGWYRQVKATKRGEMNGRESERPIVPLKPGEPTRGTLGREGDNISCDRGRATRPVHRGRSPCQRNDHGSPG